jgi:DNA-binding Lrp family transcriptional regulator
MILRELITNPAQSFDALVQVVPVNPETVQTNLIQLEKEGLIKKRGTRFSIA